MKNLTDQELIFQFTNGNSKALEALIYRHKDKLLTSIYLLVKDRYLAEDIMQDVFVKVIDKLNTGKYTDEGKFFPWLMRISYNLCMDHFRKTKSMPVIRMNDGSDIFETLDFAEPSPEQAMSSTQTRDRVRIMLDRLPADQREVIILRHYANLSFKEIARLCQCNINTALGRMRYGLLNLRKMMVEKQISF